MGSKLEPRKVLIVEPDRMLGAAMVISCLEIGLEPKLCRGPSNNEFCPGIVGFACPRAKDADAVLVSVTEGWESRIVGSCSGTAPRIIASPIGLSRTRREVLPEADAIIDHPYYPDEASNLLARLAFGHERI